MSLWILDKFHGGLATGDKIGIAGSFYSGQNLDIHSEPDKLQIMPKTTKDSGDIVTDLVLFMTSEGINNDIYAIGDTGNFYKRTAGTWMLIRTLAGGNAQGMGYFNGLIYFASNNKLGTFNPSTSAFNESYQTLETATWHPMTCFLDKIIIGNGLYLASIDASSIWDSDNLTLITDYTVKCLEVISGGNYLLAGTEKADKGDARLFLWDGFATNYNDVIKIQENGINAIVNSEGLVVINAGVAGNLYQYTGNSLVGIKTIPFVEKNLTAKVYPGATATYQGSPLFGVSEGTSLTVKRGVYSWTSAEKNYPTVLNLDYTVSTGTLTGTGIKIGSLFSEGENELYISWKDGSNYGVDLVDGSGVFAIAEYQSLIYDGGTPYLTKLFTDFKVRLSRLLRTGEVITVYYDADRSGSWTSAGSLDFSVDGAIIEKDFDFKQRAGEIQIKFTFTIAGSTSPAIDSNVTRFVTEGKL